MSTLEPAVLTVHAAGGRAMMEDAKAAAHAGTKVVGVTVMTSFDAADLASVGAGGDIGAQVARLAGLAREAGLDGLVCPGTEVAAVKAEWPDAYIVVPGVRAPGAATPAGGVPSIGGASGVVAEDPARPTGFGAAASLPSGWGIMSASPAGSCASASIKTFCKYWLDLSPFLIF